MGTGTELLHLQEEDTTIESRLGVAATAPCWAPALGLWAAYEYLTEGHRSKDVGAACETFCGHMAGKSETVVLLDSAYEVPDHNMSVNQLATATVSGSAH